MFLIWISCVTVLIHVKYVLKPPESDVLCSVWLRMHADDWWPQLRFRVHLWIFDVRLVDQWSFACYFSKETNITWVVGIILWSTEDYTDILVLHQNSAYMSLLWSWSEHVISLVTSVIVEEFIVISLFACARLSVCLCLLVCESWYVSECLHMRAHCKYIIVITLKCLLATQYAACSVYFTFQTHLSGAKISWIKTTCAYAELTI